MEVVDSHQHVGGMAGIVGMDVAGGGMEKEVKRRAQAMDEIGITWAVIQPAQIHLRPHGIADTRKFNDEAAALRRLAPKLFRLGFGTVDPMQGDESIKEIERCIVGLKLHGISWHHRFQGTYIDSPLMIPALNKLRELGGSAIIHTADMSNEAPWRLVRMARKFPEITFLALDAFHSSDQSSQALLYAETEKNILWDMGGPYAPWPIAWTPIERWIAEHGAERLTYSADYIGQGEPTAKGKKARSALLERIMESGVSEANKELIVGGNIRRAFAKHL